LGVPASLAWIEFKNTSCCQLRQIIENSSITTPCTTFSTTPDEIRRMNFPSYQITYPLDGEDRVSELSRRLQEVQNERDLVGPGPHSQCVSLGPTIGRRGCCEVAFRRQRWTFTKSESLRNIGPTKRSTTPTTWTSRSYYLSNECPLPIFRTRSEQCLALCQNAPPKKRHAMLKTSNIGNAKSTICD